MKPKRTVIISPLISSTVPLCFVEINLKVDPILIFQDYQRKLGKDKLQKLLLSEKYDSVEYRWQGINWIVFEPTQIKSIFNNGDFNPNNPDISK